MQTRTQTSSAGVGVENDPRTRGLLGRAKQPVCAAAAGAGAGVLRVSLDITHLWSLSSSSPNNPSSSGPPCIKRIPIWSLCVKGAVLTLSIPTPGGPRLSDRPSVRSQCPPPPPPDGYTIIIITYFAFLADAETCETGSTHCTHTLII